MDALELLASIREQRMELDRREKTLIATLHDAGVSYQAIANVLGTSRQRAAVIGRQNGATVRIRKGPQYIKKAK